LQTQIVLLACKVLKQFAVTAECKKTGSDAVLMTRRIRFLRSQFIRIQNEARRRAGRQGGEICGLIVRNGYFLELIQLRNNTKRGGGFSFYFREVRSIQQMANLYDHEIVGTFHSHPQGIARPGRSDLYNAVDDSVMLIYDVLGRSARLWHVKGRRAKKLQFSLL